MESTIFFSKTQFNTPPYGPPLAANQAFYEPERITTVYGTSRRQGLAIYNTQKVTGQLPRFHKFCTKIR